MKPDPTLRGRLVRGLVACIAVGVSIGCFSRWYDASDFKQAGSFERCWSRTTVAPDEAAGEIWLVLKQSGREITGCYGRVADLGNPLELLRIYVPVGGSVTSDPDEERVTEADLFLIQVYPIAATAMLDHQELDPKDDDLLTVRPITEGVEYFFATEPLEASRPECPATCGDLLRRITDRPELGMEIDP